MGLEDIHIHSSKTMLLYKGLKDIQVDTCVLHTERILEAELRNPPL